MKYKSLTLVIIGCLAITAPAALAGNGRGSRGNWGGSRGNWGGGHGNWGGRNWGGSGNWRGHGRGWRGGNCFYGSGWDFAIGFGFPFYGGFYPGYYPYGGYGGGYYPYGGYYGSDYQYDGYQGYQGQGYYDTGNVYRSRALGDRDAGLVARVQQRLARAGLYRGPIDGVLGDRTRYAIRVYERSHGLPADGRIDPRLLATMGIS